MSNAGWTRFGTFNDLGEFQGYLKGFSIADMNYRGAKRRGLGVRGLIDMINQVETDDDTPQPLLCC